MKATSTGDTTADPGGLNTLRDAPHGTAGGAEPGEGGASAYGTGALVISLDFEIHWGVRDLVRTDGPYAQRLRGVWQAVPRMLQLFTEMEVAATWATVGFLFARSRADLERFSPVVRPTYTDPALLPYGEAVGDDERSDPFHLAPTLVQAIRDTAGQEVATHTFSHYYCLAPGQTRDAFAADLRSAVAIAERIGVRPRSIVFPRNQHNPAYDEVLLEAGIVCYRGNPRPAYYRTNSTAARLARLADAYLPLGGALSTRWEEVTQENGLCNVPATLFLRPYSPMLRHLDGVRLRRITGVLRHAARRGEIVHLWWHPHNFGAHLDENLAFLRKILEEMAWLRENAGMRSMTMHEVARAARAGSAR